MNNTANFYNTYVTAVALQAITWKYYLVFVCLNVVYGITDIFHLVLLFLTIFRVCLVLLWSRDERSNAGRASRRIRCAMATASSSSEAQDVEERKWAV